MMYPCKKPFAIHSVTAILLTCFIFSSCATVREIVQEHQPAVDFQKVRFTDLNTEALGLAFDLKISNPNRFPARLDGFDYNFIINDTSFLTGQKNTPLTIEALGESLIEIPLTLNFKNLYSAFQTLKTQDSFPYRIETGLHFNLPALGKINIPFAKQGSLPLLKAPIMKAPNLELKQLNISGADLELTLRLENPNAFDLLLKRFSYDFSINGQSWAKGITQQQTQIMGKAESALSIPISLDFLQMGQSVYRALLSKQSLNYALQGNFDAKTSMPMIEELNLPFNKSGQLTVTQ